jgi:hypothetical protein
MTTRSVSVTKVAVLTPADIRPKDLSRLLDVAFEDCDEVLQFVVEGYGCSDCSDVTEADLMAALIDYTAERLTQGEDDVA